MFGFGLPILFPIAALNFTIAYFTEQTMLYYSYKLPPMYDEKLNEIILRLLRYVPIVYLAFGYWMCSSNQLLSNDYLVPLQTIQQTPLTQHTVLEVFSASGLAAPAWPLLVMTFVISTFVVFGSTIYRFLSKFSKIYLVNNIEF